MLGPGESQGPSFDVTLHATLRALPPTFSEDVVAAIDVRLGSICASQRVAIPWAIESGSRAWGFPSPDSDFDCRFVFVRPVDHHLSPWARRDVIETPLIDELDVNGWELGKALKLLLKGNAVIIEWLRSPIIYRGDEWFRDAFLDVAMRFARRGLIGRHYLHLGERQRRVYFADGAHVPQKKIFYALRPASTLRWLRLHPEAAIAPMHFPTLMAECDPPSDVAELVSDLVARKAITRELGSQAVPAPIAAFIDQEFALARAEYETQGPIVSDAAKHEAEMFLRQATLKYHGAWPG
ncbi:MAG: nucleotidyltransferase domain-containing protein [Alphaproteobacteria bacterium]|nr:nucleotidyltransferase domain-containing protein [Alphaproteobacteria bacterium]